VCSFPVNYDPTMSCSTGPWYTLNRRVNSFAGWYLNGARLFRQLDILPNGSIPSRREELGWRRGGELSSIVRSGKLGFLEVGKMSS
jgi:hypothetical protein